MSDPEMRKIVDRLQAEQSWQSTQEQREVDEKKHTMRQAEHRRIEELKEMISSWYEVMKAADYPEAKLIILHGKQRVKGLFATRVESHKEECAGWCIGDHYISGGHEAEGHSLYLNLLVDGRLVEGITTEIHGLIPAEPIGDTLSRIRFAASWRDTEKTIPHILNEIAEKAGVEWSFHPDSAQ